MDLDGRRLPAAVVFDLDGTLVDTETIAGGVLRESLAELGHEVTDHDVQLVRGRDFAWITTWLDERFGVSAARYRELASPRWQAALADGVPTFDDTVGLLEALHGLVPLAVCTSSGRSHLETILATVPALAGRFAATVSATDVAARKPDPEPYARAVGLLGVPAAVSVAIEDTEVGVTSAAAAGLRVIARPGPAGADLSHVAHVQVDRVDLTAVTGVLAQPA